MKTSRYTDEEGSVAAVWPRCGRVSRDEQILAILAQAQRLHAAGRVVPRPRLKHCIVLQVAGDVWRHGCVHDCPDERGRGLSRASKRPGGWFSRRMEPAAQEDVRRTRAMQNELLKEAPGKKSRSAISTPRDGRNGGGATNGQHCAGLPDFWGQRDLLSLRPEVARPERADRRPAGRIDGKLGKTRGFGLCFLHLLGLCFLHLRNVQGHAWNHKRV